MKTFSQFLEDDLDEAVKRKVVIRGGKRKVKFRTDREKYAIVNQLDIYEKIYIKI